MYYICSSAWGCVPVSQSKIFVKCMAQRMREREREIQQNVFASFAQCRRMFPARLQYTFPILQWPTRAILPSPMCCWILLLLLLCLFSSCPPRPYCLVTNTTEPVIFLYVTRSRDAFVSIRFYATCKYHSHMHNNIRVIWYALWLLMCVQLVMLYRWISSVHIVCSSLSALGRVTCVSETHSLRFAARISKTLNGNLWTSGKCHPSCKCARTIIRTIGSCWNPCCFWADAKKNSSKMGSLTKFCNMNARVRWYITFLKYMSMEWIFSNNNYVLCKYFERKLSNWQFFHTHFWKYTYVKTSHIDSQPSIASLWTSKYEYNTIMMQPPPNMRIKTHFT